MRENGEMGIDAANQLVDNVLKADTNSVGSLCGVTKTKISLSIPRRDIPPTDLIFIATELEANSWAESNSGKGKPTAEIRRRASRSYGDWSPLLFAAREGIHELCSILIQRKADIDQKDQDKANPGYTALITAATRGDIEMVRLLVEANADLSAGDRNGKTALVLADQRGFSSVVSYLQSKMETDEEGDENKDDKDKEDATTSPGVDASVRRGSVQSMGSTMYKGLQEKAEKAEKTRLNAAAQLADARRELWEKLTLELEAAQRAEREAKLSLDEAMKAQAAIAAGKGKGKRMSAVIGSAVASDMARQIMSGSGDLLDKQAAVGSGGGDPEPADAAANGAAGNNKTGWQLLQGALGR